MRTPGEDTTNDHTADQTQLEDLWPREHDLPPRWDGLPVQWDDWSDTAGMIICPPPRRPERCHHCGTAVASLINIGRIWTDEASAPPAIGLARLRGAVGSRHRLHRGRLMGQQPERQTRRAGIALTPTATFSRCYLDPVPLPSFFARRS